MLVAKMDFLTEQQTVGLAAGRQGSGLCASAARAAGLVRQTHRVGDVADEQRDGGEYLASRRRKSAPPALFPPRAGASCEQGRRAANEDAVALFPSLFSVVSAPVGNAQTTQCGTPPAFLRGGGHPDDALALAGGIGGGDGDSLGGSSGMFCCEEESYHMYAVFDGHGGESIARHCSETMHKAVAEEARKLPAVGSGASMSDWARDVFTGAFHSVDSTAHAAQAQGAGSTAVVALVGGGYVAVGNCGDSRAVLCRGGRALPLSADHKPERPDEMRRVEELGGQVVFWNGYRVMGVLAMSRAIGDHCLRPFVVPDPEVRVEALADEDDFLILASDGLWDALSNDDACNAAARALARWRQEGERASSPARTAKCGGRKTGEQLAADVLVRLAIARGSADNVSAVVVDLKAHRPSKRAAAECAAGGAASAVDMACE